MYHFFFFFFQAEDGIRDLTVTGVQTCALPISSFKRQIVSMLSRKPNFPVATSHPSGRRPSASDRSEEHTSELQSQSNLVCRLLLEKKNQTTNTTTNHHLRFIIIYLRHSMSHGD